VIWNPAVSPIQARSDAPPNGFCGEAFSQVSITGAPEAAFAASSIANSATPQLLSGMEITPIT
jgi:hypothetical protein